MLRGISVVATFLSLAACDGGVCGVGTVRFGDTCVAVDPFDKTAPKIAVDPPLYTREVGTVRLMSDEPATIYYTIDGTSPTLDSPSEPDVVVIANVPDNAQLRYFAVDLAGNRSADELRLWIIDRSGPGAPLDFKLDLSGTTRNLTWTSPPDPRFGGVLVARVEGQLGAPPESGKTYAIGDQLSPGVTVVATTGAEASGAFTEQLAAPPGLVRYVGWAFDDLHNYGPPAGDYKVVAMPPQSTVVSVNAGAGSLSVTTPPSVLAVTGDAQLVGTTLTVHLSLRNNTTRVLYGPKMVLTSTLPGGITWSNSDGLYQTKPYRAYGAALLPGTTAQQTWTFTGAASNTTLSLSLDLVDGFIVAGSNFNSDSAGSMVDFQTGVALLPLSALPTGNGGRGMMNRGGFTPDGKLITGARNAGAVSSFDLVSGDRQITSVIRPQKSHVPQIILDRSGSAVYALVADGHPYNINNNSGNGSATELVMLDAGSLTVGARLDIGLSRNRDIQISPDGRLMLIATGLTLGGVIVVDLTTLTIKTRILPGFRAQNALFAPDGSVVCVGEQVAIYTLDGNRTAIWETPGTSGKVVRAVFGSTPNILYIGRRSELVRMDLRDGTGTIVTLPPTTPPAPPAPTVSGRMLDMIDGKLYALTSSKLTRFDADVTTIEATLPGFPNLDGHWIGRSPF